MKGPFQFSLADERALREAIRRRGTTVLHLGQHSIAIRSTPFSHDIDLRVRDITDRDCPAPPVIYRDQNQPALPGWSHHVYSPFIRRPPEVIAPQPSHSDPGSSVADARYSAESKRCWAHVAGGPW